MAREEDAFFVDVRYHGVSITVSLRLQQNTKILVLLSRNRKIFQPCLGFFVIIFRRVLWLLLIKVMDFTKDLIRVTI